MIHDLLDVFRKNSVGDDLVLDNYQLKEGLYIKLYGAEREPEILKVEKKQTYSGELWAFFKMADFYSQLVEMNKPVDPKKQIHSNNIYSITFKAGTLTEGVKAETTFKDSILRYFMTLRFPKKDDDKILKDYHFQTINEKIIQENCDYIISHTGYIKEQITEHKIKETVYVKLYFDVSMDDYIRESKRYLVLKIFNKNDYNVVIDNVLYGLSNSNMGMNAKKPFLEHKTTGFKVPFRLNVDQALDTKNLFTWLDGQKDEEGKSLMAGYLPIQSSSVFSLKKEISNQTNAQFVHIEKGIQPIIDEYDFLPGITDTLKPTFELENFLGLDDFKPGRFSKKSQLEQLVDEWFFYKNLIRNYFNKSIKPSQWLSSSQVNLLIRYKEAMHNYFRKGDKTGFVTCIDQLSQAMLKELLLRETFGMLERTIVAKGMNLRLSIFKHFKVKEKAEMGDNLRGLAEALKEKFVKEKTDENIYCESDQEFYYYAGQLVRYLISKSQAHKPNYDIINHVMKAKNIEKFKQEILKLHNKYSHEVGLNNSRYNKLFGAVMGYECQANKIVGFDMFMAGVASKNMVYFKEQKEDEANENE